MRISCNPHRIRMSRGFTLVELLTVVTIILILSGLVIGVTSFVQRKAAVDKARVQLRQFELKIEDYKRDAGGLLPATTGEDVEARPSEVYETHVVCVLR